MKAVKLIPILLLVSIAALNIACDELCGDEDDTKSQTKNTTRIHTDTLTVN